MVQALDDWFCQHNVTLSNPITKPVGGRLDPIRLKSLFTADTKTAVKCCKEKAMHLTDPLPLEDMHDKILPNPNSSHQLTEHLSKHGESKLEAFYDRFAHFANCGMRDSLADNLNLADTARHNLAIRHKRSLVSTNDKGVGGALLDPEYRKNIQAGWDRVVPCFNHSELWHINRMAHAVDCSHPFPHAEVLPEDNGKRFFSEHLTVTIPSLQNARHGEFGECVCNDCRGNKTVVVASDTTTVDIQNNNQPTTPEVEAMATTRTTTTTKINNVNSNCGTCQQASQSAN